MRTLRFNVTGQTITLDPNCDVEDLIPGTKGYVTAKFVFTQEWDKCTKVAAFYSNLGREYEPQLLKDGKHCVIPQEALEKHIFKVKVFGKSPDYELCTNKLTLYQRGG